MSLASCEPLIVLSQSPFIFFSPSGCSVSASLIWHPLPGLFPPPKYEVLNVTSELEGRADYLQLWFTSPPGPRVPGLDVVAGDSAAFWFSGTTLIPLCQLCHLPRAQVKVGWVFSLQSQTHLVMVYGCHGNTQGCSPLDGSQKKQPLQHWIPQSHPWP